MEKFNELFAQVAVNVCKNPEQTAFFILFNLLLLFVLVYTIFARGSKIKKQKYKIGLLEIKLRIVEENLNDVDSENEKLSGVKFLLLSKVNSLLLEKQYIKSLKFDEVEEVLIKTGVWTEKEKQEELSEEQSKELEELEEKLEQREQLEGQEEVEQQDEKPKSEYNIQSEVTENLEDKGKKVEEKIKTKKPPRDSVYLAEKRKEK